MAAATETPARRQSGEKRDFSRRLHRIAGQVRGLERMIEEERDCVDVLTQVAAVSTALESLALKLLAGHVAHCVADALAAGDREIAAEKRRELVDAVERFARTR